MQLRVATIINLYIIVTYHHLKKWGFLRDDPIGSSIDKLSGCVPSFVSISIPLLRIFFAALISRS